MGIAGATPAENALRRRPADGGYCWRLASRKCVASAPRQRYILASWSVMRLLLTEFQDTEVLAVEVKGRRQGEVLTAGGKLNGLPFLCEI